MVGKSVGRHEYLELRSKSGRTLAQLSGDTALADMQKRRSHLASQGTETYLYRIVMTVEQL